MKKSAELLDFEAPLAILLKEIEALSLLPASETRDRQVAQLRERVQSMRAEIYSSLSPWQRVQLARHPNRPGMMDYVGRLFQGFTEIHGDRRFADDHAIVTGFATFHDRPVLVAGHQKSGADTKEKIYRNFGYAKPEGYRKALRAMRLAEKFGRAVVVLVDTPAAYPGIESEERGVAEAIAYNLREMAVLRVPVIVAVCGEGGSGGALGLAVGDAVIIQEYAIYSVIPPEGCAAILWRDANRKVEAAEALKLTAPDMLRLGIVDAIVPEPPGGAHSNREEAARLLDAAILEALERSEALDVEARLDRRYQKFRNMGRLGIDFVDDGNGERRAETGGIDAVREQTAGEGSEGAGSAPAKG